MKMALLEPGILIVVAYESVYYRMDLKRV